MRELNEHIEALRAAGLQIPDGCKTLREVTLCVGANVPADAEDDGTQYPDGAATEPGGGAPPMLMSALGGAGKPRPRFKAPMVGGRAMTPREILGAKVLSGQMTIREANEKL